MPPGGDAGDPNQQTGAPAPDTSQGASPAPPQPAPQMQQGTRMVLQVVSGLRAIAKAFPATAPIVAEMNDKARELVSKMMESSHTGEPQAGPLPV